VTSTATYNPDQEQTGVTQTGPSGTIASDAYTYDAAGNQTRDVSLAGTTSYSYDALNRLTGASYPNGATQAFTYDAAGNRTSETQNGQTTPYTYNAAGELTAVGSTAYAYDAGGDVTQAGSTSYAWNAQGDLTSTTQGGSTTSYTYDADGVRASATTGSATTSYLTDTEASLPQVVSAGGTSYVSTLDGQAVEQVSGSTPQYLLSDALGSVTDVTSGSGSVAGTAAYDAYGDQTAQTGASSIFGYAGQETDPTGLQYLRARYLDPATGSFLSPDTVQPNARGTQGYDLYSYAADDPATATDPTGHDDAEEEAGIGVAESEVNPNLLRDVLEEAERGAARGGVDAWREWMSWLDLPEEEPWPGTPEPPPLVPPVEPPVPGPLPPIVSDPLPPLPAPQPAPQPEPQPTAPTAPEGPPAPPICSPAATDPSCSGSITLYQYTTAASAAAIAATHTYLPGATSGGRASYGVGMYLTDLSPATAASGTRANLSIALFSTESVQQKTAAYVEIAVNSDQVRRVSSIYAQASYPSDEYSIFLYPSSVPFTIDVVGSGPVPWGSP
jgi:RHS repeat-associated protein